MGLVITEVSSRIYSRLGQAGSLFGMGLFDAIEEVGNTYVLTADMGKLAGMNRFKTKYPEYYVNVGIAEQNLIGMAAGIASEGYPVVASAQAVFISMRSFEQIRQYMGYMKIPFVVVGLSAGFGLTYFGNTHYAIEDIAVMRAIPGMTILSPSDSGQAAKAIIAALKSKSPVYIRCTGGMNNAAIYKSDYEYEIGKAIEIKSGTDVAIFSTGAVTYNALQAASELEAYGVSSAVIDVHTIKPLDIDSIDCFLGCRLLVSVEEHNVIGGLGAAISEYLAGLVSHPRLIRIGIKDQYFKAGDYPFLIKQSRLDKISIVNEILKNISLKDNKKI